MKLSKLISILLFTILASGLNAQGFLHVSGKNIVDGNNNNFIIRSIGTGNWMIQEGYMMLSSDVAGTQHEFRKKLTQTIGQERTEEFYNSWLENHFTETDVDSMAAWGFNSIRVALHYKWFTLPIEDEPVQGEHTWLNKGFDMLDSLLVWCKKNQMYLILDLHGAPGGQGYNASISDYDPSKPSLWESDLNKQKTVALWQKLAERYNENEWIGGYDLINEVNWTFPGENNLPLRELYIQITDSIRAVDQNHIIFIEGNGFANDFNDLTPPWDDNMVYSFHKYWSYNNENSLDWVLQLRDRYNRPLWLGEAGENSNTWFTNLVKLSEKNNIGWSWWPVKKAGLNNILRVEPNQDYLTLLEYWRGNATMSSDDAYQAVMTFSEQHNIANCHIQYDVIDALIRQPQTSETKPFKQHAPEQEIFASDYDLGRNKFAYFDTDTANYHLETDNYQAWNKAWQYRNDGVDIGETTDSEINNGYSVEWTEDGEWLQYTIQSDSNAAYKCVFRAASESRAAQVLIEVDGKVACELSSLPVTGAWDNWRSTEIGRIILPKGETKIKVRFEKAGINFNYFKFFDPVSVNEIPFKIIYAETSSTKNYLYINLNKPVTTSEIDSDDFTLKINEQTVSIETVELSDNNNQQLIMTVKEAFLKDDELTVSYNGSSVINNNIPLYEIQDFEIINKTFAHQTIPGIIEAEDFIVNHGFVLEECQDQNGGLNLAYADENDYADYLVNAESAGNYQIDFRTALAYESAQIYLMNDHSGNMTAYKVFEFTNTGGWQNWATQSYNLMLPQGKYVLRIKSKSGQFNLNRIEFKRLTNIETKDDASGFYIYPNPAENHLFLSFSEKKERTVIISNISGKRIKTEKNRAESFFLDTSSIAPGMYLISVNTGESIRIKKVIIK